jgi:hypothetical protein
MVFHPSVNRRAPSRQPLDGRDALDWAGSLPDLSKLRIAFRPWRHKGILESLSSCKDPADEHIRAAFQVAKDAVAAYDNAWEAYHRGSE